MVVVVAVGFILLCVRDAVVLPVVVVAAEGGGAVVVVSIAKCAFHSSVSIFCNNQVKETSIGSILVVARNGKVPTGFGTVASSLSSLVFVVVLVLASSVALLVIVVVFGIS